MDKSNVLFTKEITPESLVKIYQKLGKKLEGKVGVKIHTGEPPGNNFLKPEFMKDLVKYVNGTLIECNTAYGGQRLKTQDHLHVINLHEFDKIANVDVMDAEGEMKLPVRNGKYLDFNYVGSHLKNYDSLLILSHFKGHPMAGYGGALKNISIGVASSQGKMWIHSAGKTKKLGNFAACAFVSQDAFLESMAEAASTIVDFKKPNILYINVMCNLSVDCDCVANPATPKMKDIGILASLDPVAIDKACIDLVYNSNDVGKKDLIRRIEKKHGTHILDFAEKLGVGSQKYNLINID